MKSYLTLSLLAFVLFACSKKAEEIKPVAQVVEAACGQCQFKLEGAGCNLAVRVDGKAYFVSGTSIDEHGNAHGADGFCEVIRKAEVIGDTLNGKFAVTHFKLLASNHESHED
jgi:hypothetical protein